MRLSNEIRAVLASVAIDGEQTQQRVFALMVSAVLRPEQSRPFGVADWSYDLPLEKRWVYDALTYVGLTRVVNRLAGWTRLKPYLLKILSHYTDHAERLFDAGMPPVQLLWSHWIMLLAERELGYRADRQLLGQMWWRAFYWQSDAGHLHELDGRVYDGYCALHAAYNSAKTLGDAAMLAQVRRAACWYAGNAQSGLPTEEPWGLAAFAFFDETRAFAERQLHDVRADLRLAPALSNNRLSFGVGLLADAAMTLEDTQ